MMKRLIVFVFLPIVITAPAQHNVRFRITTLPQSKDSNFYVAGSFNGWNAKNEMYKLHRDANGNYFLETRLNDGMQEFKMTRGSWSTVECGKNGAGIANRYFKLMNDTSIEIGIADWSDRYPAKERKSTASRHVHIVDTAFLIPQLNRKRRVWVYLPSDYATSQRKYPVLYMHDGQNVFDDLTAPFGEWGVDEFMDSIDVKKSCIVIAIDHGGPKRINEYCPYDFNATVGGSNAQGKGEGDEYVEFLVQTLKPFIDKKYRTLTDRRHTFIAGSSMGGVISMYAVLKYPEVFGGAGVFSPAFWVGPKIFDDIKDKGGKVKARIYFYAGGKESDKMVPDLMRAHDELVKTLKSPNNILIQVDGDAHHNEAAWRKWFPKFYLWVMNRN